GPTITSHASANAKPWLRTERHRTGDNQMSLTAISPITTGASTTNEGRVRHSSPNSNPASAILDSRGAFKASTSASAAMLKSENGTPPVITNANRSASGRSASVAKLPASQNTALLVNMSSAANAT